MFGIQSTTIANRLKREPRAAKVPKQSNSVNRKATGIFLFNQFKDETEKVAHIVDDTGEYDTDWDYAYLGIKEGWLKYVSHYVDYKGVIHHNYAHITK